MANDLVEKYRRYYIAPSWDHAEELFASIVSYDLVGFDAFQKEVCSVQARPSHHQTLRMRSSGSTGSPIPYELADGDFWVPAIETIIKNRTGKTVVFASDDFIYGSGQYRGLTTPCLRAVNDRKINFVVNMAEGHIGWLAKTLKALDAPLILWAWPRFFLRFLNGDFLDFVRTERIEILTTDYDAFFNRQGLLVNDNMVDWLTGLNFYTCEFNTRHFLPIFLLHKKEE